MRSVHGWTFGALLLPSVTVGQGAAEKPPEIQRPKYVWLRYNEDWSVLADRDPAAPADSFDALKYLPLTEGGELYLTFSGQVRSRVEAFTNFNFNSGAGNSDAYWLNRFLLGADLHATRYLRGYVEGKSALSTDRDLPGGRTTVFVDEIDLQQAFGDLRLLFAEESKKPALTLRGGRQELLFGVERLVGPSGWSNTLRTFDGAAAIADVAGFTVTGFWTESAPVQKYEFNSSTPDIQLYGVYAAGGLGDIPLGLDFYWLGLGRASDRTLNSFTGREDRQTFGGRAYGDVKETPLDYEVEGAYQTGTLGGDTIDAFMVASILGAKIRPVEDLTGRSRAFTGFDYASGGDGTGSPNTFNQLFPTGHPYFGMIDVIGRQNIIDAHGGLAFEPLHRFEYLKKLLLTIAYHYFWRADSRDALYNAGGAVVRQPTSSNQNVGSELDLVFRYPLDVYLLLELGYGHFFPAEFVSDTGDDEAIDFGYLTVQFTF